MGIVTSAAAGQLSGLHMAKAEAWRLVLGMPQFLELVQRQTVIGAHRTIIDYLYDLLIELLDASALTLPPKTAAVVRSRRFSPKQLSEVFASDVQIPIAPDQHSVGAPAWAICIGGG